MIVNPYFTFWCTKDYLYIKSPSKKRGLIFTNLPYSSTAEQTLKDIKHFNRAKLGINKTELYKAGVLITIEECPEFIPKHEIPININTRQVKLDEKSIIIKNALDLETCDLLYSLYSEFQTQGMTNRSKNLTGYGRYNIGEVLEAEPIHYELTEILNSYQSRKFQPTYNFWVHYTDGVELKPHLDNRTTELLPKRDYSASLMIAQNPHKRSSLFIEGREYILGIGDIILFEGKKRVHWRPRFRGKYLNCILFFFEDLALD